MYVHDTSSFYVLFNNIFNNNKNLYKHEYINRIEHILMYSSCISQIYSFVIK